jgi:hypothetical protein
MASHIRQQRFQFFYGKPFIFRYFSAGKGLANALEIETAARAVQSVNALVQLKQKTPSSKRHYDHSTQPLLRPSPN